MPRPLLDQFKAGGDPTEVVQGEVIAEVEKIARFLRDEIVKALTHTLPHFDALKVWVLAGIRVILIGEEGGTTLAIIVGLEGKF